MQTLYTNKIANDLNLKPWQVENCVFLFEDGNTIPFISRYRKENTGGLDDVTVALVKKFYDDYLDLHKRKTFVINAIQEQNCLDDRLKSILEASVSLDEIEDIYLPFKPKRKTKAAMARDNGLQPLADFILSSSGNPFFESKKFLNDKVKSQEEAIDGAKFILAETFSEKAEWREDLRNFLRNRYLITKQTKKAKEEDEAQKYKAYFDYSESLMRMAPHRLLAILRAENDGYLNIKIDVDSEKTSARLFYLFCQEYGKPNFNCSTIIRETILDSVERLLLPSISNDVIKEYKKKADIESIKIFSSNLSQLLLASPLGQKNVLAIDPGYKNGCKIACLDKLGNLRYHTIIYPHPPQSQKIQAIEVVNQLIKKYNIEAIAIGNGTASRETESLSKMFDCDKGCEIYVVSEDGASIYSASEVAREEFPNEDVTVRGAVSIGRRLIDPLAELVKIDPKSLGIGQYQHDVDQKLLKNELDVVVQACVNKVGVDVNTASKYLLSYVSGIGERLAENIIDYRNSVGGIKNRQELRNISLMGPKAFEQCAGFLRIKNGDEILDSSAVHPEAYSLVKQIADDLGLNVSELIGNKNICDHIDIKKYVNDKFGVPTITDIVKELIQPGLDPRSKSKAFAFAQGLSSIDDLVVGMTVPGIVTNITAFGAFVDIGVHVNGLIHISQLGGTVLKLHQHIEVNIKDIDYQRKRISLSLK